MYNKLKDHLAKELKSIEDAGLYKKERIITSSQDAVIKISTGEEVINFCANNYLGLSNNYGLDTCFSPSSSNAGRWTQNTSHIKGGLRSVQKGEQPIEEVC